MKTAQADCRFPVLGFTPDADVWGFPDMDGLTSCGPRTLKKDMQSGMELVDADGRRWVVRSVRRTGRAGSLLPWLLRSLLATPQWRIEHELEPLPPVSLEEAQARVCAAMAAHPDYWCEEDERATVLPARLAEVRATKTIAGIHDRLGLDTFQAY